MNIVIIPADKLVGVDGVFRHDMEFDIDSNIHAIHWDSEALTGTVEFTDKPAERIDSIAPWQHIVDQQLTEIQTEKDEAIALGLAETAERSAVQEALLAAKAAIDAVPLSQVAKRRAEYPSLIRQMEALYADRTGDPSKLADFDNDMAVVNSKYPL